ncbi:NAD(P)H-dependent FMN reductase [Halovenus aranensis]|uniref:NAD(P)H-dependent FMN reductase n=1 Tax=Halovenus aranensis TaxID=890420 RepID=A0A1G8VAV0_9EURY|nr:NAD(P)H-dependent oxidoreductase [Halovenus aranensis]SDJ63242.1 NAD(P)H-dependent FMN reductase [Halovenus aranensis]
MRETQLVAICGSLRGDSATRVALAHTLAAAEEAQAQTTMVDLREYDLPMYDGDAKDAGDARALRREMRAADGIVLGTPIYHGSIASPLKTALDYCGFEEFEDKPVGLLTVAGGRFPTPSLLHLRTICVWLRAVPLSHQVGIPNVSNVIEDGRLTDEDTRQRIEKLGRKVTEYATLLAREPTDVPTPE